MTNDTTPAPTPIGTDAWPTDIRTLLPLAARLLEQYAGFMESDRRPMTADEARGLAAALAGAVHAPIGADALSREAIRAIFLQHGFTIKEGQADLNPYVYEAAEALVGAALASAVQPTTTITPLEEQQMFDDWCPYKGSPDSRTVWAAAIDAANGMLLAAAPKAAPAPDMRDAYLGAREDLLIWKRRALVAERDLRTERATSSRLAAEINAINGPTHLGEPAPVGVEPVALLVRKNSWRAGQWEVAPPGSPSYGLGWADQRKYVYAAPQPARLSDDVVKDAERYRWLREGNDAKHGAAWHVAVNLYGCEWDAAIDAARAAKEGAKP